MERVFNDSMNQFLEILAQLFGMRYLNMGLWKAHRDINKRVGIYRAWAKNFIHQRIEITKKEISEGKITKKTPKNIVGALLLENPNHIEEEIVEEFLVFYIAGTDTTANFVRMIIYYIASNPHVEAKLR